MTTAIYIVGCGRSAVVHANKTPSPPSPPSALMGSLTLDKGCTKKDAYGSNDCTLAWGAAYNAAYNLSLTMQGHRQG
jgi:hypothetical protein